MTVAEIVPDTSSIATPALVVFPRLVEENIRRVVRMAGSADRLRPHVKTHKMAEVARLQISAGITRFKCATIAEAEMLAQAQVDDLLLAYQPVGPHVERLARLAGAYPRTAFSVAVDDLSVVRSLSKQATANGVQLGIFIDLDVGMGRTGIAPGPAAKELLLAASRLESLKPRGLHVYDGQVRHADFSQRKAAAEAAYAPVADLRHVLEQTLGPLEVCAGGTPTFPCHALEKDRTCSPGTCLFWDASYAEKFPDLTFEYAARLVTRVVSKPGAKRVCLDLGYKAVSPDNANPRAIFPTLPDAEMVVHSEEHLVLQTGLADTLQIGDAVWAIPYHVCPTVALHAEALVSEGGKITGQWRVAARDRRITI